MVAAVAAMAAMAAEKVVVGMEEVAMVEATGAEATEAGNATTGHLREVRDGEEGHVREERQRQREEDHEHAERGEGERAGVHGHVEPHEDDGGDDHQEVAVDELHELGVHPLLRKEARLCRREGGG